MVPVFRINSPITYADTLKSSATKRLWIHIASGKQHTREIKAHNYSKGASEANPQVTPEPVEEDGMNQPESFVTKPF